MQVLERSHITMRQEWETNTLKVETLQKELNRKEEKISEMSNLLAERSREQQLACTDLARKTGEANSLKEQLEATSRQLTEVCERESRLQVEVRCLSEDNKAKTSLAEGLSEAMKESNREVTRLGNEVSDISYVLFLIYSNFCRSIDLSYPMHAYIRTYRFGPS
jgi:chromosome segregation ATPase